MGIAERIARLLDLTLGDNGFPPYRLNEDGTPVTPVQRKAATEITSKSYGLPINTADFLVQRDPTVAYA